MIEIAFPQCLNVYRVILTQNADCRFNMDLLSHGLPTSTPIDFYEGAVVPEGYNTHLNDINSGRSWTDRPPGTMLSVS